MAYRDFNLKRAKHELDITVLEQEAVFTQIPEHDISDILTAILKEHVPLARAINTEKARSELIIANILVEVRKIFKHQVSLFSGIEFNVDKEKSLNGYCDFIMSHSPEQLLLSAPIVTIVEAKNENIISGLGQCIAEMVAARMFNEQEGNTNIESIYGTVTTGTAWKFLKMNETTVTIDLDEYSIDFPNKIVGILFAMINQQT